MRRQLTLVILMLVCLCGMLRAADVIPPRPTQYFNDYAHLVQPQTAAGLNEKLAQFERDTSNQIVVAIYPTMRSDSSIEDYTVHVAQNWQVGQKDKKNGAVLFIFVNDRKLYLQVGYGLEGALPDVLCKRIIADEIAPRLKQNDPDGGLTAGVTAILAATKGEYQGTGTTATPTNYSSTVFGWTCIIIFFIIIFVLTVSSSRRGTTYNSGGYSSTGWQIGGAFLNILLSMASSGGSSSGGSSSGGGGGGGGGFSSGGGSFGGGGAGGSW